MSSHVITCHHMSSHVITCHHMSSHVITCHRYHIPPSMPSGMCFLRFSATVGRLAKATLSSSAVHKRHNEWSTNNDSKGSDIRGPNFINSHKPSANWEYNSSQLSSADSYHSIPTDDTCLWGVIWIKNDTFKSHYWRLLISTTSNGTQHI